MEYVFSVFPPVSQKPVHQIRGGDTGKETKKSTKEKSLCSLRLQRAQTPGAQTEGALALPQAHLGSPHVPTHVEKIIKLPCVSPLHTNFPLICSKLKSQDKSIRCGIPPPGI